MSTRKPWWRTATLSFLTLAAPAFASPAEPPSDQPEGVHIVRPGDTLEQLAASYLGSARRWPEIARMNPSVGDPKRLPPGLRLKIAGNPPAAAARIESLSNPVEERPAPIDWSEAKKNDFLVEQDGVRTHPKSSAAMEFGDGTRLTVTEDSLVFLRHPAERQKGLPRKAVEIVEGQADVASKTTVARAAARPEVEILLGRAKATSRPNAEGMAEARARRPGDGGAKVMVYGGSGEVEAAGAKVQVAQGMGTSVAKEGPPATPEKLLEPPNALSPLGGSKIEFANVAFYWTPVEGAGAYIIELCKDKTCGALLDRVVLDAAKLGEEPQWHPKPLPVGTIYWRATARSKSGLDGYPSQTGQLEILSDKLDQQPPVAKLDISGTKVLVAGKLYTPPGAAFEVAAADDGCGLYLASPEVVGDPNTPGDHKVVGYAIDRCGNRVDLPPIAYTVDAEAPVLHSMVVEDGVFANEGEPKATHKAGGHTGAPTATGLYWSSDGRRWLPLWMPGKAAAAGAKTGKGARKAGKAKRVKTAKDDPKEGAENEIASGHPRLFLAANGVKLTIDGQPVEPGAGKLLAVTAEDAGAGVSKLRFHTTPATEGKPGLEIEAVDLVGNTRTVSWPLVLP